MTFAFIEAEKATFPITAMCATLGVSASGYHAWCARPPSARQRADEKLSEKIQAIHTESRGTYGSPRVHADLRLDHGIACGRKRVERLMRAAGLRGVDRRRRRGCTVRDEAAKSCDDLVNRAFSATEPNRLWAADIFEHPSWEGKVYVAVVLDAFSRAVVGWSIADHMGAELVCDAFDMAIWRRRPSPGAIHHSDHGSQGGLNRPSQHLVDGGVDGHDEGTPAGGAVVSGPDPVAGPADGRVARGSGQVLGCDCSRREDRGSCGGGGGVIPRRVPVVPSRWRRESLPASDGLGPLPVVRGA